MKKYLSFGLSSATLLLVSCSLVFSVGCGQGGTTPTTTSTTGTSTSTVSTASTSTVSTTSTSIASTTTTTTATTSTTNNDQAYFPHASGNSWRTEILDDPYYYVTTFEGTITISSITAQRLKQTTYNGSSTTTGETYYVVNSSGVYTYGTLGYPTTEATPVLTFPLTIGRSWIRSSGASMTTEATIVSHESVTVDAGTFACYKVDYVNSYSDGTTSTDHYWYGLNAGVVKITITSNPANPDEFNLIWKNF